VTGGKFITFEGGEGGGKSTQAARLCAALERAGVDVVATREPGGTDGAEDIRALLVNGPPGRWQPLTEALLHSAARSEHLTQLILPALDGGQWVVSDRFADSTLAYQGYAQGLGPETVSALTNLTVGEFEPDLTLILDLPPEAGLLRAEKRAGQAAGPAEDRYERMGPEFHAALRDAFLEIARQNPERCAVIDGDAPEDRVEQAVWSVVTERLGIGQ
jgi:dTMP kinase